RPCRLPPLPADMPGDPAGTVSLPCPPSSRQPSPGEGIAMSTQRRRTLGLKQLLADRALRLLTALGEGPPRRPSRRPGFPPLCVEDLEERTLLSIFTVINT